MTITVTAKVSRDGKKTWYYYEKGKGKGERWASKIYTYTNPDNALEKQFNKNQLLLLERTRMEMMLHRQTTALKTNFLHFYKNYVIDNTRPGDRHPAPTLKQFQDFTTAKKINPDTLDEDQCTAFRRWLLDKFKGETPMNYFSCFKQAVKAATKAGYFSVNPAADVRGKKNPTTGRDFLTGDEFLQLIKHPCPNPEVYRAALTSLYTGLAFCDVNALTYDKIRDGVIDIARMKSKVAGRIPLHAGLEKVILTGTGKVFNLPTANGCNKILKQWALDAGLNKKITWHCLRLSFSVELLNQGVSTSTVAGLMLHKTSRLVESTYRRYVDQSGIDAIKKLPG